MKRGVLLYCFDTPEIRYSSITDRCVQQIRLFLDLPVTIVTDPATRDNIKSQSNFILTKFEKNNTRFAKPWYNLERHQAFEHSPYDHTLVIDVDYLCFSNKLLKLFDTGHDFLIHKDAHDVTCRENMRYDREAMLDLVWATVLIFRKTQRVRAIFDAVKLIKQNYAHFCNLYRISYRHFRNDYAFAIALNQIYGYRSYDIIPDTIATVPVDARIIKITDRGALIESNNKVISLQDQDLHFLNKDLANV